MGNGSVDVVNMFGCGQRCKGEICNVKWIGEVQYALKTYTAFQMSESASFKSLQFAESVQSLGVCGSEPVWHFHAVTV